MMATTTDVKKISNPLTIIGMFAVLAEISGTVVLPLLKGSDIQDKFIWYVMLFPVLLVVLFFYTLWTIPENLYGPTDYSNEDNFIKIMSDKYSVDDSLQHIEDEISKLSEIVQNNSSSNSTEDKTNTEFYKNLTDRLNAINNKLAETKEINNNIESNISNSVPKSAILQFKVIKYIEENPNCSAQNIAEQFNLNINTVRNMLHKFVNEGLLIRIGNNKEVTYKKVN